MADSPGSSGSFWFPQAWSKGPTKVGGKSKVAKRHRLADTHAAKTEDKAASYRKATEERLRRFEEIKRKQAIEMLGPWYSEAHRSPHGFARVNQEFGLRRTLMGELGAAERQKRSEKSSKEVGLLKHFDVETVVYSQPKAYQYATAHRWYLQKLPSEPAKDKLDSKERRRCEKLLNDDGFLLRRERTSLS